MSHQEALTNYLAAFIDELVHSGVENAVISPGSRSTPIAMLIAEHPSLDYHLNIDERSAAFFALGLAKQTRKPVILLCTSGTAAANYYPAIIEAKLARVPLIVLTADRPHELRDIGAPQAINQIDLYGNHVKWFSEMALPEQGEAIIDYVRTSAARAVNVSIQVPAGPVHLNFPLREPLIPTLDPSPYHHETNRKNVMVSRGKTSLSKYDLEELHRKLIGKEKGIIICGVIDDPEFKESVKDFAEMYGYPIFADPLSQLRSGDILSEYVVDSYDAILKELSIEDSLKPEIIIRFGGMPVSKPLTLLLKRLNLDEYYIIEGGSGWRDPIHSVSSMIYCDEINFCNDLVKLSDKKRKTEWLQTWIQMNEIARSTIQLEIGDQEELDEGKVVLELMKKIPQNSTIFVGNSMPIRDIDTFFFNNQQNIRVLANRGANGIDGVVSSAIGASVHSESLYLLIGDLSFFHDLNGLLVAKMYNLNINIIVINNNGGGIFSYLPQANEPKHFEALFGTPTDLEFEYVARMYDGNYSKVNSWEEFHHSLDQAIDKRGLNIIEVPTNRAKNVQTHRKMWKHVSRELEHYLNGEKS